VRKTQDQTAKLIAALPEIDELFRMLSDFVPALIFVADASGANIYSNSQFSSYTGIDPDALLGDGWLDVIHPDDRKRAEETWQSSWRDQKPYQAEYRFCGANGDYRPFLVRGNPVGDKSGRVSQWVGTCTDIADAVALRDALAQSRTELETINSDLEALVAARTSALTRSNQSLQAEIKRREATQTALMQSQKLEALGQLTSGIAHDFNNILAAITGGMSLIENRVENEFVKTITGHCKDAAFRGGQLIKQMLAFARQEILAPVPVDLAWLSVELKPLITQAIPGNIVTLSFSSDLPKVLIDPVLLETALLNLAVNARDAMPGGGKLSITAKLSLKGERGRPIELTAGRAVAITVRDNGIGIPPDVVQRVTEPFYTTKEPGKGTGLGLAMVHGFISQSGGAMRIESHPGKGTSVTLYLPCSTEDVAQRLQAELVSENIIRGDANILLVDDDADVRAVTAAQLRELGYTVTEATGHDDALAAIAAGLHADCVVSDVVMPGGDGIALARSIRASRRDIPIMFISGRADSDRLAGELVLQKPFTVADLSQAVAEIVTRAADERAMLVKIDSRIRSHCLKEMLGHWNEAKLAGKLALFATFNPSLCSDSRNLIVVKVDPAHLPMRFEYMFAGEDLEKRLDRPITGTEVDVRGVDVIGSIEESYRRCAISRLPVYDYTCINLGDGAAEVFERVILPYSADGQSIDRLVVIVSFRNFLNN
jgi:PAS domain S-box-containing protein